MSPQKKEERASFRNVRQGITAIKNVLEHIKSLDTNYVQKSDPSILLNQLDQLLRQTYIAAQSKNANKVASLGDRLQQELQAYTPKITSYIGIIYENNDFMQQPKNTELLERVTSALKQGNFDGYASKSKTGSYMPSRKGSATPRERSSSPELSSSDNEDNKKMLHNNKTKRK